MLLRTLARRPAGVAAAVASAIVVAACGGPVASSQPTLAPGTLAPSTQAPLGSIAPGFSFTLPSVDKELEGLLPDDIAGEPMSKSSVGGATFLGTAGSEEFQQVLAALNKTPDDLTAALAGNTKAFLIAFRIDGVPAGQFLDAFVRAASENDAAQLTDLTIAGKPAKRFSDGEGTTTYLYLTGDTIVTVSPILPDQALLDEIFQKLP